MDKNAGVVSDYGLILEQPQWPVSPQTPKSQKILSKATTSRVLFNILHICVSLWKKKYGK